MKRKFFILLLSVISAICLAVGLSACGGNSENSSGSSDHEHSLIYYSAVDATETEDGHKEYWYCAGCGKYFSDAEGNNEIDVNSIIIAALDENTTYTITFIADNNIISEITYSKGDTNIEIPEVPAKYGYEGIWSDFELYTGNITVVAVYTPVDCYVNYENTKGAYNSNVSIYTIENGITLNDLYLDGYTFNGWYTEDGEKITEISYNNYSSGITLIADWSLIVYTATFVDENGKTVATRTYTVETEYISVPEVPEKSGYTGAWESYNLTVGGITVRPVYTANSYTATFVDENGDAIYYSTYTVENDSIYEPSVPYKQGYTGVWQSYSLKIGGVTISPVYTAINYNVIFTDKDGDVLHTVTYTVEDTAIDEPEVPTIDGYAVEWENYQLTYGEDVTVTAIYTTEGATEGLIYSEAMINENGIDYLCYYVSGYTGSAAEIFIPSIYHNVEVKGISDYAFYEQTQITSVSIADSITYIGGNAFNGCTSLKNVIFGEYSLLETIGHDSFTSCSSLESITIPDSVITIDSFAFYKCTSLKNVIFGEHSLLKVIGAATFRDCNLLNCFNIPDGVTSIGSCAFYDCSSITSVTIPSCIESIGEHAFRYCYKLVEVCNNSEAVSVTIGSTDNGYVGYYAVNIYTEGSGESHLVYDNDYIFFYDDDNNYYLVSYTGEETELTLPDLEIANSYVNYGIYQYAFYNNASVTSLEMSNYVTSVGQYAFYNCSILVRLTIGSGVTSIDNYAFYNCTELAEINYNAISMENLNSRNYVFYCTGQDTEGITVTVGAKVKNIPDYLFNPSSLSGNIPKITIVTFETNSICTRIGNYSFYYCSTLTKINLPASVLEIGDYAFCKCTSLADTSISEHSCLTSIGKGAYFGCTSLVAACIPTDTISIGEYAFNSCSFIENIFIMGNLSYIGIYAFEGCYRLVEVHNFSEKLTVTAGSTDNGYIGYYAINVYTTYDMDVTYVYQDDYTFISDENHEFYLVWYKGEDQDLILPDLIIDDNSVEYSIRRYAFIRTATITSVTIPSNVTSICDYAFYACSQLVSVTIDGDIDLIGVEAFNSCASLKEVIINGNVASIGEKAFCYCIALESVMTDSIGSISDKVFGYCELLADIDIREITMYVSRTAFSDTAYYKDENNWQNGILYIANALIKADTSVSGSYIIREGTSVIVDNAFYGCSLLENITIPDSVIYIGKSAFYGCYLLEVVNIPDGVTSIRDYTFYACYSLNSVTFGEDSWLESIGENAFWCCYSLYTITIPKNVTSLGSDAFANCEKLVEVYNLSTLSITAGSYENGCAGYYAINVYTADSGKSHLTKIDNYIFVVDGDNNYYLVSYVGVQTKLSLPDLIIDDISIDYAIYKYALSYNKSITYVEISDCVVSIGSYAFSECTSLESITIPNNVVSLDSYVFNYCTSLKSVSFNNNISSIGEGWFYACSSLTIITIPDGVTSIGDFAFGVCTALTSIILPDGVLSIGDDAFVGCSSLISITISDSITSIGEQAFYFCTSLESVIFGENSKLEIIGDVAFGYCTSLTSITIPKEVVSIGDMSFIGCDMLSSIVIPDNISSINYRQFEECTSLESIIIPNSITSIGYQAFYNCSALTSVYYYGTADEWTKISINAMGNNYIASATIYYYAEDDGTTTEAGNYWYYEEDGNIVTWSVE